jgi:hypothetical protein
MARKKDATVPSVPPAETPSAKPKNAFLTFTPARVLRPGTKPTAPIPPIALPTLAEAKKPKIPSGIGLHQFSSPGNLKAKSTKKVARKKGVDALTRDVGKLGLDEIDVGKKEELWKDVEKEDVEEKEKERERERPAAKKAKAKKEPVDNAPPARETRAQRAKQFAEAELANTNEADSCTSLDEEIDLHIIPRRLRREPRLRPKSLHRTTQDVRTTSHFPRQRTMGAEQEFVGGGRGRFGGAEGSYG